MNWNKIIAASSVALLSCANAQCEKLEFGGAPAELSVSRVSDDMFKVELSPLDENGKPRETSKSESLLPLPEKGKWKYRAISGFNEFRDGKYSVTVQGHPMEVTIRRRDGTTVQTLKFESGDSANGIEFQAGSPVLGLGEGG